MEEVRTSPHEVRTSNARAREGDQHAGTLAKRKKIDWESINRAYRAGHISIRLIADVHGCSEGAIRKKAKKEGWERDLTKQVQERVRTKLVASEVATPNARAREEEIVEQASNVVTDVLREHRKNISDLFTLSRELRRNLKLLFDEVMDLPSLKVATAALESLVRAQARLIPLERQAFNLDEHGGGGSHDDDIKLLAEQVHLLTEK